MGHGKGRERVLLHQQHGHAVLVDAADDVEDLLDQQRGQTQRGLVEHDHVRAAHERAAHGQHLLFTARKRAALLPVAFLQAGEQRIDTLDVLVDAVLVGTRISAQAQVLHHGQMRQDATAFRRKRDAPPHHLLGLEADEGDRFVAFLAGQRDLAADILVQAGDGTDDTALAGAVGAHQRDDAAALDVQADTLHGFDAAVTNVKIPDFQHTTPRPRPDRPG